MFSFNYLFGGGQGYANKNFPSLVWFKRSINIFRRSYQDKIKEEGLWLIVSLLKDRLVLVDSDIP